MTLQAFLDEHFGGEEHAELRQQVTSFTEGFDVADVKKVSTQALYNEWKNEYGPNFRITQGYGQLINYLYTECLKNHCTVLTSSPVLQIDWQKNKVQVVTKNGQVHEANKVIFSAPIHLLHTSNPEVSVDFNPEIPNYRKASSEIGFGEVVKVVVGFEKSFWKSDTMFVFGKGDFPTWWTQLPNDAPVLVGWAGGPKAAILSGDTNEVILEKALQSLADIFAKSISEIKDILKYSHVANWQTAAYSVGAYSYDYPSSIKARALLNTPINDTIYFAGESLYDGDHPGTVEAALVSAKKVADKILDA